MTFELRGIAQTSATGMVDCLVLGTFVALLAGLVLRVTRRLDAGTRFSVYFASLMAIAAMPFMEAIWKAHAASSPVAGPSRIAVSLPSAWAIYLFGLWAALAAVASARVATGLWHLYRIRRTCVPIALDKLDSLVRETLIRKQTIRKVTLCTSDQVQVPTAIGLFRPAVIVPGWALDELSGDELNQVLLHELAHLRRWDDWTNLLQQVVKALFFFHPAVWWIERRVSLEREMACDDAVVEETASPRAYAECLAHLAERSVVRRSIALAQALLGRVHQISQRVAQILDANRPARRGKARKVAVPLVGLLAGASVVAMSNAPKLISFSDSPAPIVSTLKGASLPDSSVAPFTAPVIPARFVTPATTSVVPRAARKKVVHFHSHPVDQDIPHSLVADNTVVPNRTEGMIHLASVSSTPAITAETVLVVVESTDVRNDQQAYQIRVWRVLLWRPPVNAADQKSSPKT